MGHKKAYTRLSLTMPERLCAHCHKPSGIGYMLNDELWARANLMPNEVAHIWCVEERLGVDISIEDFLNVPLNQNIKWALKKLIKK